MAISGRWIISALDILQKHVESAKPEWVVDALDALAYRLESECVEYCILVPEPRNLADADQLQPYLDYMERRYGV